MGRSRFSYTAHRLHRAMLDRPAKRLPMAARLNIFRSRPPPASGRTSPLSVIGNLRSELPTEPQPDGAAATGGVGPGAEPS